MNVLQKPADVQAHSEELRRKGRTIAFVPTMGFLHEGHLSLIREGRRHCDDVIVSIFVNPTQFGPDEDLDNYPRNPQKDLTLCREVGVDTVFTPDNATLYGDQYQTYVILEKLPNHLCGLCRPVHFRGVATIVTKLFNIVQPHVAVFGQKDFQQLAVIRQMTQDLNFNIQIVGSPTVREPDGLAMSSRNAYLKPEQRVSAQCLFKALQMAQEMVRQGEKDARKIVAAAKTLIDSHPETQIDYITICDPDTLENISEISRPVLMALAVKVGQPRLIDNMILNS
jgi:pantoate--beta-alanine ligase